MTVIGTGRQHHYLFLAREKTSYFSNILKHFQEVRLFYLIPESLGEEGDGDAALPHHLGPQVLKTSVHILLQLMFQVLGHLHASLEGVLQGLEATVDLVVLVRPGHEEAAHHHEVVHLQLPVSRGVVQHRVDLRHLVLQRPPREYRHLLHVLVRGLEVLFVHGPGSCSRPS